MNPLNTVSKVRQFGVPAALLMFSGGGVSGCENATSSLCYGNVEQIDIDESPFPDSANVAGSTRSPNPTFAAIETLC